ncbi:unnamed protein product [Timema podura]|uniref:Phospholysine phosphohistidine inorganic pyrophosphate phosphatase n=1 Tax=Timema podura TaxID=61482 RepID=A0ABN7PFJ2_TIMPD|nr:unnamed protein product [Timema podura]
MSLLKSSKSIINGVLLDISGVLKDGSSVIPGSLEAFHKLQNSGLPVKLVTNETQETKRSLAIHLSSLGYDVNERDILPPCPAVVKLLKEQGLRPHLLVHPNVLGEFQELDQSSPNCVVIGDASDNFTYKNLDTAFKTLINMPKPRLFTLGGAQSCGLKGVLVRTGKFRPNDEFHPHVQPDAIVDDLAEAVQLILDARNNDSFS